MSQPQAAPSVSISISLHAEIQPCESVACDNGGTCVSGDPFSYECLCPPGFNGSSCQENLNICGCENGGTCISDELLNLECRCPEGFGGSRCELDINECLLESTCAVGLFCVNEEPGFRCLDQNPNSELVYYSCMHCKLSCNVWTPDPLQGLI
jgi:hypothetical protein